MAILCHFPYYILEKCTTFDRELKKKLYIHVHIYDYGHEVLVG